MEITAFRDHPLFATLSPAQLERLLPCARELAFPDDALILREGDPADTLYALRAGCVALDSRGHGALRHLLHGSVALDVLKQTDRLLLVSGPNLEPPPARRGAYRIVVMNDGSSAAEAVLRALAALLPAEGVELTLLRVHLRAPETQDDVAALESCRRELEEARALLPASLTVQALVREIPRGGGVDTAVVETALELGAHAIALSTHGQTASRHVIIGSMGTTMLGRSQLPLLLARSDV